MNDIQKIFVLDTNVLIHRPDAINSFKDREVVLPLWVLEELDGLKSDHAERGRNARMAIRYLDEVSKHGQIHEGVRLENGAVLRIALKHARVEDRDLDMIKKDNKIILTAYEIQQEFPDKKVFFVSKDINARVKASALGIKAVDYEKQKINLSHQYTGFTEMILSEEEADQFKINGFREVLKDQTLFDNQFVQLHIKGQKTILLGKYTSESGRINSVNLVHEPVLGISPLNMEQQMAMTLLLDDSIKLVTLIGKAGTGKTLLAVAAGLNMVLNEKKFTKVLISRPIIPMGKDLGYLPGDKLEKMTHWMQPIYDNLELILTRSQHQNLKSLDQLINNKHLEVEALTYIRGRSLPHQFIIIDEGQNLSPHEIKTIVSRAGDGTKVVITGDPFQIDSPYLDAESNGLSYLVEAFKNQSLFGHVLLGKSERSRLAELATELL